MRQFKDWFFEQFPESVQQEDTNKNVDGEGSWQRYLQVHGLELDEEIVPYIEDFSHLWDYQLAEAKYLPLLSGILGYPPSFDNDVSMYRKILAYALAIYKVKGTKRAYQIMLGILGMSIQILSDTPEQKITYDMDPPAIYDEEPTEEVYDSECEYCTNYRIGYSYLGTPASQEILDKAERVICFLQPINAKFEGWVYMVALQDHFDALADDIDFEIIA